MKNTLLVALFVGLLIIQARGQAAGEITPKGIAYPRYNDGNRPVAPLTIGLMIFNTSQNTHQYWNGSTWTNVSTPGSGGGPWSVVGSNINNNTGNKVGINTANPNAALEVQGGSFSVNQPYTITSSSPTNTYTMPYNGTITTIVDQAGYILDPGGNGNFLANTNYNGYASINLGNSGADIGLKLTFESLDLGTDYGQHAIIVSQSSDVNSKTDYLLEIRKSDNIGKLINNPLIFSSSNNVIGGYYTTIYIHFVIKGGYSAGTGFKILFQGVQLSANPNAIYTEIIGNGIAYNSYTNSIAVGTSRASGFHASAFGQSEAKGTASFAGGSSSALGAYSTSFGDFARASGDYSTAIGFFSNTNKKKGSFSITGADPSFYNYATNDKDYQMKMHFNNFQFLTGTGNSTEITDGLIATTNSLSVYGSRNISLGAYGFLNSNGSTGTFAASTNSYAIYANGRIAGIEFNAFSDARHKKLRSRGNGASDLALLNQLKVSNYTFIDTVAKGKEIQMGFIAQEVEKIIPNAVKKLQDYIPSIYDMAEGLVYDAQLKTLTVTTKKPHDFEEKDEIKLISLEKEHKVKADQIVDNHTFVVNNWEKAVDKIFVFGKQVNDFRTVDYDRLFTLGISSIQELSRKIDALEQENTNYQQEIENLHKTVKDFKQTAELFSSLKAEVEALKSVLSKTYGREKITEK